MKARQTDRISLYPILAINFVGTLGFSIVLPFLVFLVTRFGGNAVIYGLMGATYSFFQLIGAPILGRWSDRWGRRRVLLLSHLGTLAAWGLFILALSLPVTEIVQVRSGLLGAFTLTLPLMVLGAARALDGITGGNVSVANAYLADVTEDTERTEAFGKMAVSANLGFVLGPALAGVLGATVLGELAPVLAALLISGVAAVIIWFKLEESSPCRLAANPEATQVGRILGQEQKECYQLDRGPGHSTLDALRQPGLLVWLAASFLVFLGFNFFYIAFPIHAVGRLEWKLAQTGLFFSALGLFMAVVQGPVLKAASKRFPETTLIMVGSLILAGGFFLFRSPDTVTLYAGAAAVALGNGLMWPSLLSVLSKSTKPDMQGTVQGLSSSSNAIASIVGLVVGGLLYEQIGVGVFVGAAGVVLPVAILTGARAASRGS